MVKVCRERFKKSLPLASRLSDVFQVAHCEVDGCQARVDATGSGHPDGPVDTEGSAKELAFFLWLLTCLVLVWCSGMRTLMKDDGI